MADDRATHDVNCSKCQRYMYSLWWRDIFDKKVQIPEEPLCKKCDPERDEPLG
jgi:hypothetical protein